MFSFVDGLNPLPPKISSFLVAETRSRADTEKAENKGQVDARPITMTNAREP